MLRANVEATFHAIDAGRWNALGSDPLSEHGVLLELEDANLPGVRLWAVTLSDETGRWVAAAPFARLPVDAMKLTRGAFREGILLARRIHPRFLQSTLLICGTPLSVGNPPARLARADDAPRIYDVLARTLDAVADREGIPWRAFKEFASEDASGLRADLGRRGYLVAASEPNARIAIRWSSFEEFLRSLRSHYRRKILLAEGALARADITVDEVPLASAYDRAAHRLYEAVADRAPVQLERLTSSFFTGLGRLRANDTALLRFRRNGRVVGWVAMLLTNGVAYDLFHGIDYRVNETASLYFNQIAASIRWAIRQRARLLYLGQSSETAKARFGAEPVPLWTALRHRHAAVRGALRAGRRQLFPEPPCAVRHVFSRDTAIEGGGPCAT